MANSGFVEAARPFLFVLQKHLQHKIHSKEMAQVMIQCSAELDESLRIFENLALRFCGNKSLVEHGSFLLCTLSDELLIRRFDLSWTKISLLARHHANSHGGEMSWKQLEQLLNIKSRKLNKLELAMLKLYEVCIALGLRGRYRAMSDGEQLLYQLRLVLHRAIYGTEHDDAHVQQLVDLSVNGLKLRQRWPSYIALMIITVVSIFVMLLIEIKLSYRWHEVIDKTLTTDARAFLN